MTQDIHQHRILILDFGSQYTQLIARRIREIGVYCEIWPWDVTEKEISDFKPRGIILSGGTPLYKKGDREDALNYRPISITTNLSKIFERILATQIGTYMNDTQQYSKCQFGFRQKFSTSDALLYCIEKWRKSLDDNQYAVVASLDLSKAFDSIDHDILMTKLEHLGFDNQSTTLLKSFLHGRYQAVKVKDTVSS